MRTSILLTTVVAALLLAAPAAAHHPGGASASFGMAWLDPDRQKVRDFSAMVGSSTAAERLGSAACTGGQAAGHPCQNVDLLSYLPLSEIGGGSAGNDIWGWEDRQTGRDYAIMGRTNGTAFVDITDPAQPVYVGNLPTHTYTPTRVSWRDIKVYRDHAYVVAEHQGHGMQVFDLTRLRGRTTPTTFAADTVYKRFGSAHNIFINEDTGFAYSIGSNSCAGGPHIVDIRQPKRPRFAACYGGDGYTHDIQCIAYDGPDSRFSGREICFASNEDTVTILDLTNKKSPVMLARRTYPSASYTHQGWLTPDRSHFVFNDELDELDGKVARQTTYILDVRNLTNPPVPAASTNRTSSIDHNLYITKGRVYESNYTAGLQIFDAATIAGGQLAELGYFDVYPADDQPEFQGTWSNYPFYDEDVVAVSGIDSGLFILAPRLG